MVRIWMIARLPGWDRAAAVAIAAGLLAAFPDSARAQSSSLFGRAPLTLEHSSFTFIKIEPPREIKLNDIITVLVDEKQQTISLANLQRRKRSNVDASLQNWMKFKDGNLVPDIQGLGDPGVQARLNSQVQTQTQLNTGDTIKFRVAATVVDIRPNGNLVLEARRRLENNEDTLEQCLTGVVRREDVLPNNTVMSEDVAELVVKKLETGQVRDAYRRGWLIRLLDRWQPF